MDGWPREISERNDQSLMSTENINDDTRLKGFSVCVERKRKKKNSSLPQLLRVT